jgi:hypothetical protein
VVYLRQQNTIPVRRLWEGFNPLGVNEGIFVLLRGYIDESYDKDQKIFALSCLLAPGKAWTEIERVWKLHLRAKNKELAKAGRPAISRYHASDCNGRRGEFKGWNEDERNEFVVGLLGIMKQYPLHTVAYDVDLNALRETFPEFAKDRLELAYSLLIGFLMHTIGADFQGMAQGAPVKITLFHDRTSKYDPAILRAFNREMADPAFPHASYFTSITSLAWTDCIVLQPADLVAFEIFREAENRAKARKTRKSFSALFEMEGFGIHAKSFVDKATMLKLRELAERHNAQRLREEQDNG